MSDYILHFKIYNYYDFMRSVRIVTAYSLTVIIFTERHIIMRDVISLTQMEHDDYSLLPVR